MKETIGERIKKLRTYRKLTQEEVGKIIGASKQTLHKYENGIITNIPLDKIEALANLFDVSPSYIMGWDSKETIVYKHQEYEQKVLFPYNKLSNEGKEKVITYTQDLVDSGKYSTEIKPTVKEMIAYLQDFPLAGYNGNLNIHKMSEEELYTYYKLIKDNE